jgi:hypothetical protein
VEPVEIALPFTGRWLAVNSPARRVPSHGVDLLGQAGRLQRGTAAVAGNHEVVDLGGGVFAALVHPRRLATSDTRRLGRTRRAQCRRTGLTAGPVSRR